MAIPVSQVRALFTQALIDVYQERIRPTDFLRSFYTVKKVATKYVSIEVERMQERIAVDVVRGSDGNRNTFPKSTQKVFDPPMYKEYMDATELDLYDRVLGSQGDGNENLFVDLLDSVADRLGELQAKMERSQELQCAEIFEFGTVTTKNADVINYKRKAESIINLGSGQYFANAIDPFKKFEAGCVFLRTKGKSVDATFNAILGETAMADLLGNTEFKARQNMFNLSLDAVQGPIRNGAGAAYFGRITCGSYNVQLWVYPQSYDLDNGDGTFTATPYWNPKKVVMVPLSPRFKHSFAQLPQVIEPGVHRAPAQPLYLIGEYIDKRKTQHVFDIACAPLPVPVAVDQIYTFQAVG